MTEPWLASLAREIAEALEEAHTITKTRLCFTMNRTELMENWLRFTVNQVAFMKNWFRFTVTGREFMENWSRFMVIWLRSHLRRSWPSAAYGRAAYSGMKLA